METILVLECIHAYVKPRYACHGHDLLTRNSVDDCLSSMPLQGFMPTLASQRRGGVLIMANFRSCAARFLRARPKALVVSVFSLITTRPRARSPYSLEKEGAPILGPCPHPRVDNGIIRPKEPKCSTAKASGGRAGVSLVGCSRLGNPPVTDA